MRGTRCFRRKDGELVEVEYSTRLLTDARVHTILRDVMQRRLEEATLLENAARLREIVETQRETRSSSTTSTR